MKTQLAAKFYNLDLDVESTSNLTALANHLEGQLFVLYNGDITDGMYLASFEIDPKIEIPHSPENYAQYVIECIQSLPSDLRKLWDNAVTRRFDFGFGSGIVPPPYPVEAGRSLNVFGTELSANLLTLIGELNGTIKITIYPYQPSADPCPQSNPIAADS